MSHPDENAPRPGDEREGHLLKATGAFVASYRDRLSDGIKGSAPCAATLGEAVHAALHRPRNSIYLLGNGGSHAICRTLAALLREVINRGDRATPVATRLSTVVDPSLETHTGTSVGIDFLSVLRSEGISDHDLVVLVSGSGNSDNLLEVASYCERQGIPAFGLAGFGGGRMLDVIGPEQSIVARVHDQQIDEDVLQAIASTAVACGMLNGEQASAARRDSEREYRRLLQRMPVDSTAEFLVQTSRGIVDGFRHSRPLLVRGRGHAALHCTAEHIAHNLRWDAVFEVRGPPPRLIFSSPTLCDLTGISNDRQASDSIRLPMDMGTGRNPGVLDVIGNHDTGIIEACWIDGAAEPSVRTEPVAWDRQPWSAAALGQVLGHMLGRLVRLRLQRERRADDAWQPEDLTRQLVAEDLAQRRHLDRPGA